MSSRTRRSYHEFLEGIQKIVHNFHGPHTFDLEKGWRKRVTVAWKSMALAAVTVSEWNNDLLDAETEKAVNTLNGWAELGHKKSANVKGSLCDELVRFFPVPLHSPSFPRSYLDASRPH